MHDRLGEKQENGEHQGGLQGQRRQAEKVSEKDEAYEGGCGHAAPDNPPFPVKGPAYLYRTKRPTKSTVMADMVYS